MARTPKIAALNLPAKRPANSHPRRIKPLRRRSPRPRGLVLPTPLGLLAAASNDCPLVDAQLPPKNGILAGLPGREWSFVRPHLQCVSWQGGEILRDVATPLDCFYFPESGMVCTFAVMDDGKTLALAAIGREGFVGVPAFLGAEIAQLRVVVLVGGNALKLSRDTLRRILPASSTIRSRAAPLQQPVSGTNCRHRRVPRAPQCASTGCVLAADGPRPHWFRFSATHSPIAQ